MNSIKIPEDCAQQWEIILLLLSAEEKKIDRTGDSEIDTMSYFYRNEGVRKILQHWLQEMQKSYAKKVNDLDTAKKCDDISLLWRQKGNEKFRTNRVEESYRYYCESVIYATQDGPMYSLALANRSAALLRMKRFVECLKDIELALDSGYPGEQRHKLLLRRADCYIELGEYEDARTAFTAASDHAKALKLAPLHAAEFDRHLKILERKLESLDSIAKEKGGSLPTCIYGENSDFNAASNALELRRSDSCGRYVVAREGIRRGDVLFSEEPYAWVTLPRDNLQGYSCETCCQTEVNPIPKTGSVRLLITLNKSNIEIHEFTVHLDDTVRLFLLTDFKKGGGYQFDPCASCSRSVYCSTDCRSRGAQLFHRWECMACQANIFPTIGIAHLALRVLLITAGHGFPSVATSDEPTTASELFSGYEKVDNINIYKKDSPPFYRMFNLITNFDKMNNNDYIQYALTATMLTFYLEDYTSFFEVFDSRIPHSLPSPHLRIFAAAVLLRAMGQLVCNGHAALTLAMYEDEDSRMENGQSSTISEREVRRATAIYPSAAMMNHSCDPNIINTFYKGRLVVVCGREICAGGEVLNCYGPHRSREPASHRRAALRAQYMFTCACAACADADRRDFVYLFSAYACQSCKGPVICNPKVNATTHCVQCGSDFKVERALETLERAKELLSESRQALTPAERCEKAHSALRLQQSVWHRHHTSLRESADNLARLYADFGDFSRSVELIKQNIQSLEYQYGSFSAEVAHELRKLSEVMLERIVSTPHNLDYREWCLETHKILKKAVQLTELNYGSWEPLVKRLKDNEEFVASLVNDNRSSDEVDSVHQNFHYNLKI